MLALNSTLNLVLTVTNFNPNELLVYVGVTDMELFNESEVKERERETS